MQQISLDPIRRAISSGEFERAQLLWNSSAAQLTEEFENARFTQAQLAEIRELVAWSRTMFLCDHAHLQDQIRRLQAELRVESGYHCPDRTLGPTGVAASF